MVLSKGYAVALQVDTAKVCHDLVGAALHERCGLRAAPNPDDEAKPSRASRNDTGSRILEYHGTCWTNAETSCGLEEHVRSRLAPQAQAIKIDPIHTRIE